MFGFLSDRQVLRFKTRIAHLRVGGAEELLVLHAFPLWTVWIITSLPLKKVRSYILADCGSGLMGPLVYPPPHGCHPH